MRTLPSKKPYRLIAVLSSIVFLVFTSIFYENRVASFHFVDEEYNFVLGKYLLGGEKLYQKTFSNHQPLGFVISAAVQGVTQPNSIFLLVKRHREFMIAYSFFWSIGLVAAFGLPALLFVALYELMKIFLLGNLFLPEALSVYPLLYLVGLVVYRGQKPKKYELVLSGLLVGMIILLLAPLWPLILVITLLLLRKSSIKSAGFLAAGMVPMLALFLYFSFLPQYFYDTVIINTRYFIPLTAAEPAAPSLLKSLFAPLIALFAAEQTPTGLVARMVSAIFLTTCMLLAIKKRHRLALLGIFLLWLANLRFVWPGQEFYRGFHLLPWFALLLFLSVENAAVVSSLFKNAVIKLSLVVALLAVFVVSLWSSYPALFVKRDVRKDLYINYSNQFTMGEAVKIMASDSLRRSDTLLALPDEWLIYWQSGLRPPTRINSYYAWMDKTPDLSAQVKMAFNDLKPTFVYCDCGREREATVIDYLGGYVRLRGSQGFTNLYVLPEKLARLSQQQLDRLNDLGFKVK